MAERVGISPVREVANAESASQRAPQPRTANRGVDRFLHVQQAIGNRAMQHLLAGGLLQPKLRIGPVDDVYEREADQTADRVMRMPDPHSDEAQPLQASVSQIQRMCAECEEEEEKEPGPLQRKPRSSGASPVKSGVESRISSLRGGGQPLPPAARSFFEPRFNHNFGDVRIHTGLSAAGAAAAINARAFTLGRDIVFGSGEYAPQSTNGGRLLGHELTHVLQQRGPTSGGPVLQREEKKETPKKETPKKVRTVAPGRAKDTAELKLSLSKKAPCACLVFVHNDERNARRTAELMHRHCAYNFASVQQRFGREIPLPQHGSTQDPNGLFPREIAEECTKDEAGCRDFLTKNKQSTRRKTIKRFAQIQYFLAIKDCSKNFSLPVVALHNNRVNDTAGYRSALKKKRPKSDSTDPKEIEKGKKLEALLKKLKIDVDKTGAGDKDPQSLADLKKVLRDEFTNQRILFREAGQTNIFRWCAASDLVKCHVGNPQRPDHVIWTTKASDFATLSKKKVNVVLQKKPGKKKTAGGESESDLSTLFLVMEDIHDRETRNFADLIRRMIREVELEMHRLRMSGAGWQFKAQQEQILEERFQKLKTLLVNTLQFGKTRIAALRYVNIETPGLRFDPKRADAHFDFINEVLDGLGINCCDAAAKKEVKKDLAAKP